MGLCLLLASLFHAQTTEKPAEDISLDPKQVPAVVIQNFTTQFPTVTAAWRMEGKNYRARFVDPQNKLGRAIVYDKEGNVIRTENEVDKAGYPSAIGDYYSDNYPGETYQVWYTDEKTGAKTLYFTNRNDETIWFDKEGKIVPAKKAQNAVKKDTKKK